MANNKAYITMGIVFFVLSFIITIQVKSVLKNEQTATEQYKRVEDVQRELVKEREKTIDLEKQLIQTTNDLDAYRKEAEKSSSGVKAVTSELERYKILAGLTDVTGPGVTVTLNDSKVPKELSDSNPEAYIIHDTDLRTIVNELNSAGAEAISINDERVISTSEIRCVGPTVIVNGNKYAPPYIIKAIGQPDMLDAALNIKGGIAEELRFWKIEVNVAKTNKQQIGKYTGIVNFKHAQSAQ